LSEAGRWRKQYNETKAELDGLKTRLADYELRQIASEHGVDAATLATLAKRTDGTTDTIQELAKALPKVQTQPVVEPVVPALKPDSNRTHGGTSQTVIQVQQDFVSGRISNATYSEKMKAMGKTP
jgi:hypothetical protein